MRACVDVAVVGGGVVGCAVARRLALEGARVALLEKGADILEGASKGNSAILHTGFDAPPGTLEQKCVAEGYREYFDICSSLNLPVQETGALLSAWTEEEEGRFPSIIAKAEENGVDNLQVLSGREVLRREPNLDKGVRAAIHVPGESIVDPWSTPLAYIRQAVENGGQVVSNAGVSGGRFDGKRWLLETESGKVDTEYVVNCAGLYGDILEKDIFGESDFVIKPRKGQFVVFDKVAGRLLRSIILPVPTERTKGVVLFPTIFGNLVVGPTAEEQESRSDASVDKGILASLIDGAVGKLPLLAEAEVTATYAGIRPATDKNHYRVRFRQESNWVTLGGIRSTGLTSALGLARHVSDLLSLAEAGYEPIENPSCPVMPNLAEHLPRDYAKPGYGEIVCHCEMVTERELRAALTGPVPAGNLGGLKRRTRAAMGRCQGFNCAAKIASLAGGKLDAPLGTIIDGVAREQ